MFVQAFVCSPGATRSHSFALCGGANFLICLHRTTVAEREPALRSTSWAPASIYEGCQLCRTLHTDRFHVCLLIACPTDAGVSSSSFLFCCLVFLWTGVRGGKNSLLGWPGTPPGLPQRCQILTCQAVPSITWTSRPSFAGFCRVATTIERLVQKHLQSTVLQDCVGCRHGWARLA